MLDAKRIRIGTKSEVVVINEKIEERTNLVRTGLIMRMEF
jgi:hypothetical protein